MLGKAISNVFRFLGLWGWLLVFITSCCNMRLWDTSALLYLDSASNHFPLFCTWLHVTFQYLVFFKKNEAKSHGCFQTILLNFLFGYLLWESGSLWPFSKHLVFARVMPGNLLFLHLCGCFKRKGSIEKAIVSFTFFFPSRETFYPIVS